MAAGGVILGGEAIPGDPGAVAQLANRLRAAANQVEAIEARISSTGLAISWTGHAADAFHSALRELPGELAKLHRSFGTAAHAVGSFGTRLEELQTLATRYAREIEEADLEVQKAQARHAEAKLALDEARNQHRNAVDPAGKSAALQAVDHAGAAAAGAGVAVEDAEGQLKSLRARAHANHDEYEAAAKACCSGLEAASHLGIRNSFGSWWDRHVTNGLPGKALKDVEGAFVWTGKQIVDEVEEGIEGVENLSWEDVRHVLEEVKTPLEIVGVAATLVAVVLTAGGAAPVLAGELMMLSGGVALASAGDDALITGGDGYEAIFGDTKSKNKYRKYLLGDSANLALDAVSVGGVHAGKLKIGSMKEKFASARKDMSLARKAEVETKQAKETGVSQYKSAASKHMKKMTPKREIYRDSGIDLGQEAVHKTADKGVEHFLDPTDDVASRPVVTHQISIPQLV